MELAERMVAGGFPEAHARFDRHRRRAWFDSCVTTLLQRDVRDLANIERSADLPRMLLLLAARTSGSFNLADIARTLGVPQTPLRRYVALMEMTFLGHLWQ